ncbi:hypothetical protein V8D89_010199 [Ganoderma adspersum]
MRKKTRSFKTKGMEVVLDWPLTECLDVILNIESPDFVMDDEEDPQSDDDSSCAKPSNPPETSYLPGTSTTAPPAPLPLSQSSPSACSPLPPSLSHAAISSSSHVSPPEHGGPVFHAGFRTRSFRKPEGPKPIGPYYTTGPCLLSAPTEREAGLMERGDLFLHEDTRNDQFQAWIWDGAAWTRAEEGMRHPVYGGKRRLWFRFLKEEGRYDPNWIAKGSWVRYNNTRQQEMERGSPASPMFKGVNARVRNEA